jgi:hypothetical protein
VVLLGSSRHKLVQGRFFPLHFKLIRFACHPSFAAVQPELLTASLNKQQIYIYNFRRKCVFVLETVTHFTSRIVNLPIYMFYLDEEYHCIAWEIKFWMNFRPCFCEINRLTRKMYVSSILIPFCFMKTVQCIIVQRKGQSLATQMYQDLNI